MGIHRSENRTVLSGVSASVKILFACNTPDSRVTGMAKIMHAFADELRVNGHTVDMIFRNHLPYTPALRRISEILFPVLLIFKILRLWQRGSGKHDLVAIHSLEGAVYVLLRKIFRHWPPCVIVSYGSDEMRWMLELEEDRLGLRPLNAVTKISYPAVWISQARYATRHAAHVMLTAKSEITFNREHYGIPESRMTFIPNGVSDVYFTPHQYSAAASKLLYFGGWEWRKGTRYLIESFTEAAARIPQLTLTIAGVGNAAKQAEKAFPEHLRPQITIISSISAEETPSLYQRHDIFIFPSLFESMSLVVPEAMASGLPVITTRACGMQDIVEDGVTGLLTAPRNAAEITEAILKLIRNPALCEKLGLAAQEKAEELRWSVITQDLIRMYQRIIAENIHER